MKQTYILAHPIARQRAANAVLAAPDGKVVTISDATKKRIQEEKYHAQIGDIAKCCKFMDNKQHRDDWKRLLVDAFAKAMRDAGTPLHHDGRVMPSLDFERVVQLGIQTHEFLVGEASQFISFLSAWGDEHGVVWSEPKERLAA